MSYRFKKSVPLPTEGGIKLSKGKNLSSSWWKERWIEAVESFNDGGRLSRGRSYARKGQVLDISISKGQVIAIVQGSQKSPYRVSIEVETLPDEAWNMVTRALSAKALYAAKLFSGELPNDIETFFEEVGISLLPTSYSDFSTDCSCPDWSNPCKHIAAVLYLLGDEFGRDPFLLFKVKGIDQETFIKKLESLSMPPAKPRSFSEEILPLPDGKDFWAVKEVDSAPFKGQLFNKDSNHGPLLRSLGKFPFWRGEQDLFSFLEPFYRKGTVEALKTLDDPSYTQLS